MNIHQKTKDSSQKIKIVENKKNNQHNNIFEKKKETYNVKTKKEPKQKRKEPWTNFIKG